MKVKFLILLMVANGFGTIAQVLNSKNNMLYEGKLYYESGKMMFWMHFKNNFYDGPQIGYTESGKVDFRGTLRNGALHGKCYWYFPNGQLKTMATYNYGILDGELFSYYENGNLESHGFYKNNQKVGQWHINRVAD